MWKHLDEVDVDIVQNPLYGITMSLLFCVSFLASKALSLANMPGTTSHICLLIVLPGSQKWL